MTPSDKLDDLLVAFFADELTVALPPLPDRSRSGVATDTACPATDLVVPQSATVPVLIPAGDQPDCWISQGRATSRWSMGIVRSTPFAVVVVTVIGFSFGLWWSAWTQTAPAKPMTNNKLPKTQWNTQSPPTNAKTTVAFDPVAAANNESDNDLTLRDEAGKAALTTLLDSSLEQSWEHRVAPVKQEWVKLPDGQLIIRQTNLYWSAVTFRDPDSGSRWTVTIPRLVVAELPAAHDLAGTPTVVPNFNSIDDWPHLPFTGSIIPVRVQ